MIYSARFDSQTVIGSIIKSFLTGVGIISAPVRFIHSDEKDITPSDSGETSAVDEDFSQICGGIIPYPAGEPNNNAKQAVLREGVQPVDVYVLLYGSSRKNVV